MRRFSPLSPVLLLLAAAVLAPPAPPGPAPEPGAGRPDHPVRHVSAAEREREELTGEDHAWDFFEWWYGQRAFPNELIPAQGFAQAWTYSAQALRPATHGGPALNATDWENIGPDNVAGRILSLAVDPIDTLTVWAGSASGGLWVSHSGGQGVDAWDRVETGFPALAVSAIAIDRTNRDVMYLGTGEVGRYGRGQVGTPGARSSYGIGVLKSTDRGVTWGTTGLNWLLDQRRGVLALKLDPRNPLTLWAATSEGLYKSVDAGVTFTLSNALLMCMDVLPHPSVSGTVYATFGQLGTPTTPVAGLYRTTNGGTNWTKLASGLPATHYGRTSLSSSKFGGALYAGVANDTTHVIIGLYRSLDGGTTWVLRSSTNYASAQGWYDNVVACSPADSNRVFAGGLDVYRSTTGGTTLTKRTNWSLGYEQDVPAGGPEGPTNYVHADQHAIAFNPLNPNVMYVGCDGGVFKSADGGVKWGGANGGLVTTQFYSGFADAGAPNATAIGGLQDNGTVRYNATSHSWDKVFGGDGGWCAIDPTDPNTLYEEYVYLNMYKSTDAGLHWIEIHPQLPNTEANFIAPFVLSHSAPNVLYAGSRAVEKSTDGGLNWSIPDGNSNWNGTFMATIGVSFTSPDTLVAATGATGAGAVIQVRRSIDGAASWQTALTALPTLFPTDVAFNPHQSAQVWLTFSGYGGPHVFKSSDAGLNWIDHTGNLPDIPTQCVVVDPADSNTVYVGTDLGTYVSQDGGATWTTFDTGMPLAMIVDLLIEPVARRMRAATFGNGVFERMIDLPTSGVTERAGPGRPAPALTLGAAVPNPFRGQTRLNFTLQRAGPVDMAVFDVNGRLVRHLAAGEMPSGAHSIAWDARSDAGATVGEGIYFVRVTAERRVASLKILLMR